MRAPTLVGVTNRAMRRALTIVGARPTELYLLSVSLAADGGGFFLRTPPIYGSPFAVLVPLPNSATFSFIL